jgi:hypothetical protein
MFADEARFGRINRPRPLPIEWARSPLALIREYIYLYGAVAPKDGTCVYLNADIKHGLLPRRSICSGEGCQAGYSSGSRWR